MAEVNAANTIVTKNNTATTLLSQGAESAPIFAKIYGSVSKMSPGPAPGSMPAANTAGMMANPAIRANIRSKPTVPKPVARIFSRLWMYEA